MVIAQGPGTRVLSLLLLVAILASGIAGQGFGVARATDESGAMMGWQGAEQPMRARVLPLVGAWRPVGQEEDAPASECDVRGIVETPAEGATVPAGPMTITGWAANIAAPEGTGIDEVRIALDADPDQGGVPVAATLGIDRPDIVELLGDARFQPSGFALAWDASTTTPGSHTLYIQVHSACGWTGTTRNVVVGSSTTAAAPAAATPTGPAMTATPSPTATSGQLVFPTVALLTPTSTVAAAATSSAPTAVATSALQTATPMPSPTGSIPAPSSLTVAVHPFDGSVHLSWLAPPAMVTSYLIVVNEPNGQQRPIRDAPGSQTRVAITGLDPRIGYSLSVIPIDAFGRRGTPSAPVSTAGAPTVTPMPTLTVPPNCTPVPFGPPYCPGGFPQGIPGAPGFPGGPFPNLACPPNQFGVPMPGCFGGPFPGGGSFQLTATNSGGTTASLTWTPLPGATTYNVLQGINGAPLTQIQSAGAATTATVTLGQPNASYVFQIQAMGPSNNEIGRSNISPPLIAGVGVGVPGVGTGVADPTRSSAIPGPPAPASIGVQVTITARDVNGVPVVGRAVTLIGQRPGDTAQPLTGGGITDGAGNALFIARGTTPGPATFLPTIDGRQLPPVTVTFQ